ncbi:MAG: hypothetical protein AB8H47_20675 [Bacteroidia bacterium]
MKRFSIISLLITLMLFTHTACNPLGGIEDQIDEAIFILNQAIAQITSQSDEWRFTIEETVNELPDHLKAQGENLLAEGIGMLSSNLICVVDAIPKRMIRGLKGMKAELLNTELPPVDPTICQTSLDAIDLTVKESVRRQISLNGYDFVEFALMELRLRGEGGIEKALPGRLFKLSNYELSINAANMDAEFKNYTALVVYFNNEVLTELPIIVPAEPKQVSFLPGNSGFIGPFCPPKTRGDRELGGVADVKASARLYIVNQNEIWVEVKYRLEEPKKDHSTAEGTWDVRLKKFASNERITRIVHSTFSSVSYRDKDHGTDIFTVVGPVKNFLCIGDTGGDDLGNCSADMGDEDRSKLGIQWEPLTVMVQKY